MRGSQAISIIAALGGYALGSRALGASTLMLALPPVGAGIAYAVRVATFAGGGERELAGSIQFVHRGGDEIEVVASSQTGGTKTSPGSAQRDGTIAADPAPFGLRVYNAVAKILASAPAGTAPGESWRTTVDVPAFRETFPVTVEARVANEDGGTAAVAFSGTALENIRTATGARSATINFDGIANVRNSRLVAASGHRTVAYREPGATVVPSEWSIAPQAR